MTRTYYHTIKLWIKICAAILTQVILLYCTCIGLHIELYLAIQLFSCKYLTIKLSWVLSWVWGHEWVKQKQHCILHATCNFEALLLTSVFALSVSASRDVNSCICCSDCFLRRSTSCRVTAACSSSALRLAFSASRACLAFSSADLAYTKYKTTHCIILSNWMVSLLSWFCTVTSIAMLGQAKISVTD